MNTNNKIYQFDNGLVLLAEEMPWVESISFSFRVPSGVIYDPPERLGLAAMTSEYLSRGAGSRDNQAFLRALENLGVETSDGIYQSSSIFSASLVADKIEPALELYADMILRPRFETGELETSRQTILQEFLSLEDEPSRKMKIELKRLSFPDPWNRFIYGTSQGVENITRPDIKEFYDDYYRPNGAILGVAGHLNWDSLRFQVEKLFSSWKCKDRKEIQTTEGTTYQSYINTESAQTYIGLSWPSLPVPHPDYLLSACAISALSGGMTGRLFTEVREKRGLCYSVSCASHSNKKLGRINCFCGTRTNRAQESLDVILSEIDNLYKNGITERELELIKTRNQCALVIQQESTAGIADNIVGDWYLFHRIRTLEELQNRISSLTCNQINDYLTSHPAGPLRLVTLGPTPLKIDPSLLG